MAICCFLPHIALAFLVGPDVKSLENVLRRAVIEGQPKRLRAWRKIFIMVEGVYRLADT